ncbi:hypothetical protein [Lacinutrix chionoecetis]
MKNLFIILLLGIFSVNAHAQKPDREKIKALKVAHITEQLNLSANKAQAFWPIYNSNQEAEDKLKENSKLNRLEDIDAISEAEAKTHLEKIIAMEQSRQKLQKEYYASLSAVLSSKEILKLMQAERSFRRKMIQEFKARHRGEKIKE